MIEFIMSIQFNSTLQCGPSVGDRSEFFSEVLDSVRWLGKARHILEALSEDSEEIGGTGEGQGLQLAWTGGFASLFFWRKKLRTPRYTIHKH